MLARYVRTRDEIKKVDAVFDLIPNTAVHRRIEALLADLRVFNNVTIKLQRDISRGLQRYPSLKPQLNASANVVYSPVFEAAVVKGAAAYPLESVTPLRLLRKRQSPAPSASHCQADFATAVLRSWKAGSAAPAAEVYLELLQKTPPSSNRVERLFSQAKLVLTPQRLSLLPVNMEMLLFLRTNRSYWDTGTLCDVYRQMH
ncbi:hypothetical protein F442_20288 [Phytophthora nicotianae P10297]|uniref:HAT C-terminal dimerisation domain-containing protein n=1 Tax=Phytophthora nicotianae P10297 TaxID=1317064 RepID=W2Y9A8_PHYNI|nr:hypothetical protein F442_20288 [Phytophthora nicotianae P10297]